MAVTIAVEVVIQVKLNKLCANDPAHNLSM
jgi:hypothetical protein